jgi:4-aminobutyrate aminotransferase/(S)-3-amino-2-methylpropionate transaminase
MLSFTKNQLGQIAVQRAFGNLVEDVDGNVFLDFSSSTNLIGYNHPKIIMAIHDQINKFIGASPILSVPFIECAEKLKEMLPGELKEGKIAYTTTGSEAIDLATRLARAYMKRELIISFHEAHFGEGTSECSRLAGDYRPRYKGGLTPLILDTLFAPWPYCYRCPLGQSSDNCDLACLSYFEEILSFSQEKVAAVIVEAIPANGGVLVPPPSYMQGLSSKCKEHGIVLVVDEVFSGFGKTGKFLAVENWNVLPDIACLGKSMGGELPISAVATRAEIIDQCDFLAYGTQGSFSGNACSCAATIATINVIKEEGLLERARKLGEYMKRRLEELADKYTNIGDVRGIGLILGLELVKDATTKIPANEQAELVLQNAYRRGLLISKVGRYGNVLRMTPPPIVTKEQVEVALGILEESLKSTL